MGTTLQETPSGNRLHIGIFGKTNSGKSAFINAFSGQAVSIVADVKGTTTDPVYKAMEIAPLGLWVHCVTVPGSQCPGWIRSLPDTGCMYSCGRGFRLPGCRWSLQRTDPCRPAALPCRSGGDLQLSRAVRSTAMGIASLHLPRFSG